MTKNQLLLGTLLASMLAFSAQACGSPAAPTVGRITYDVSGGLTGWHRILTVEPDGAAGVKVLAGPSPASSPAPYKVDPATLRRLHDIVSGADFAALAPSYMPPPGGADLQDYVLTVQLGTRTITTATRDGATRPAVLDEAMTILASIMAAAGAPAGASSS